jgi:hypothetical protein
MQSAACTMPKLAIALDLDVYGGQSGSPLILVDDACRVPKPVAVPDLVNTHEQRSCHTLAHVRPGQWPCDSYGTLQAAESVFQNASRLAAARGSARYEARASEGLAHVAAARNDVEAAGLHWTQALSTPPGGVVDPRQVELHLAALEDGAQHRCWRCISPSTDRI